ncbi:MAG: tRNA (adenosine(37)-N6)-threonylcarbamoyltransferase complex transferase subunit TsaD [Candidatus Cloacimonetes bacterium]|nr:tRNA (adenosine(37)-N6)-threonylcarbamoyltransferase complex transferase subunit TsaD [Candidatus Cloacimonadota bacterium]
MKNTKISIPAQDLKNKQKKYILAFETSCDDTSVSIIDTDYQVYANIISSQPDHEAFGGILPELASRLHLRNINRCLKAALKKAALTLNDISAIAVAINPGLIGSLIVGVSFAKALAWSLNLPLIAVNHMLGHVMANKIEYPELNPPWLALVVSGGHTELVIFESLSDFYIIGQTLDDASGEAFDKVAKILNLGFPGGPVIDRIAKNGNPNFHKFPRALNKKNNFNFSFSGLKTSVFNWLENKNPEFIDQHLADIVASVQQAIVDILVIKTINAAHKYNINKVIVAGGVSANSCLRNEMNLNCEKNNIDVFFPKMQYCMDNAAMIGAAAVQKYLNNEFADLSLNAFSTKGIRYV